MLFIFEDNIYTHVDIFESASINLTYKKRTELCSSMLDGLSIYGSLENEVCWLSIYENPVKAFWRFFRLQGQFVPWGGFGGDVGLLSRLFLFGALQRKCLRMLMCLPSNGQRARPNGRTLKKMFVPYIQDFARKFRLARVSPGQGFGKKAHLKKVKSKLKPKNVKESKTKKNKPVVRSRDSKKSVWA